MNKTKENTGVDVKPDNSGHRERLKKRFMLGGGRDFPDYEMLELLLTLSIPRRDVKQIAKQLLAKFGSFAGVINAPAAALYEVPYVKENSYVVFSIVREAAIRSSWSSLQDKAAPVISNWDAMIDYCRTAIGHRDVEEFRIIFLDISYRLSGKKFSSGERLIRFRFIRAKLLRRQCFAGPEPLFWFIIIRRVM